MVFDYEGKALRNMTVEVEFTKEPEGTRSLLAACNPFQRNFQHHL